MTRLPALRLALLNASSSYDVPKLVRLRSKRLGAPRRAATLLSSACERKRGSF